LEAIPIIELFWPKNGTTIFFTGSTRVGQIVMNPQSKTLKPLALELGGKIPTIGGMKQHPQLWAAKQGLFGATFS